MSTTARRPIAQMLPVAEGIAERLHPYCARIEIAGSLRRRKPEIGDIEIVAIPRDVTVNLLGELLTDEPTAVDGYLQRIAAHITLHKNGAKYKQFSFTGNHGSSYTVDLFLQPDPATWGVNYMIRTGSSQFSRKMVTARRMGGWCPDELRFKDGRIWRDGEPLDTPEEQDVFDALGIDWIEPEDRRVD